MSKIIFNFRKDFIEPIGGMEVFKYGEGDVITVAAGRKVHFINSIT